MAKNPHSVTADFESALCEYTGAPYAVAVNSCTMAILLAVAWCIRPTREEKDRGARITPVIEIPRPGYISVPQSIIHAGGRVAFRDEDWSGCYQLKPLCVWDSARRFTSGMYIKEQMQCVSFHASKILGLEQGGAILHDNDEADRWLRRARFDGRTAGVSPREDTFDMVAWHCYMNPSTAAMGILRLYSLPRWNADLPNDDYPMLDELECFK